VLSDKLIKHVRQSCIDRGVEKRIQLLLINRDFRHVPTEGIWVRASLSVRVYVAGANWLVYHQKDKPETPTYSGAGPNELSTVLDTICV
jgi:hypothetical protein